MRRSSRDDLLLVVLLALILALAAGVRFYALGDQSLWSDEGNSAALAARSLAQIARDASNDIHPPLYYWLLHLWVRWFGASEAALRSFSAVIGVALVWATADFARRLFGRAIGLTAGFIAALAPFQVYYSQEARMYILLALEATVALLLFWQYIVHEAQTLDPAPARPDRQSRLGALTGSLLVLVWIAGLYTHYFFPIIIALTTALYLGWLWLSRSDGWVGPRLLRWLALIGLAVLCLAPWLVLTFRQLTSWPSPGDRPDLLTGVMAAVLQLAGGPARLLRGAAWGPWAIALLAAVGMFPWPLGQTERRSGGRFPILDPLRHTIPPAWALVPLAAILLLGLYREAYLKFLLVSSPAVCILLARAALGPLRRLRAVAGAPSEGRPAPAWAGTAGPLGALWTVAVLGVVAGVYGSTLYRYFTDPSLARDDYRGIARFIAATGHQGDAIVLDAPGQAEVLDYYYDGDLPIYALPRQRPLDPAATRTDLETLEGHQKVFAVYWGAREADPDGMVEGWLDSRGYKMLDQWRGDVRLAVYDMPESRPPDEAATDLDIRFGDEIVLTAYRDWNPTLLPGEVTQLQLDWRALLAPQHRYKVFIQLLDPRDQVIAQRDAEPAGGGRPTNSWQPGEEIRDNHGLLIPPGTPPGSYRRIVGLYDAETLERVRLPDGSDYLSLSPVTVTRAAAPPALEALEMQHTQRFDFGGISLLGHDQYKRGFGHAPDTPLKPGDLLHLTFYWQANVPPRADWWLDATVTDRDGAIISQLQAPLAGETYPTQLWEKGEIVRGEHDLRLPPDIPPGEYRLSVALLPDFDTPAGAAYLGEVIVTP